MWGNMAVQQYNNSHYFGDYSNLDERSWEKKNDYSKYDYSKYTNSVSSDENIKEYSKCVNSLFSAMLENNLEVTNNSDVSNRKLNQESPVADVGLACGSNFIGSNSNMFGLSSLNIPNVYNPNSISYTPGSTQSYGQVPNNLVKTYNCPKYYENNPLGKLFSQNWTNNLSTTGRAIKAASPQMSFNAETRSNLDTQFMFGYGDAVHDSRSSSPTESDTSGISSVSELSSLSDLMNNLNLGTTVGQGSVASTSTLNSNMCRSEDFSTVSSPFFVDRRWSVSSGLTSSYGDVDSIERAARLYRSAAAFCEPNCTWSGQLPPRTHKNNMTQYSCKVFLGGVPWDITEAGLIDAFAVFGPVKIEWPGKGNRNITSSSKAGYNYIIFESEKQVKALLQACTHDYSNGGNWYYKISSRRMRSKEVQIIPWNISDSNYVHCPSQRLDPSKTVFVGALHGMLTAEGLAQIMNDLFGGVVYAGIDTDKYKYPIGSGRITFNNHKSYTKAVTAAFIEVKTPRFNKRIQVDPYMEDSICSCCQVQQGPIFCRDLNCYRYFCHSCFRWQHSIDTYKNHKPMMRNKTNR